jgi:hypothetical protein
MTGAATYTTQNKPKRKTVVKKKVNYHVDAIIRVY